MHTRSNGSNNGTSTVLIVLILVFTFPIWIGLLGGFIGVVAGLFGTLIGMIAGLFGAIVGMIASIFGWAFDWSWHWPFGFWNGKLFAAAVIVFLVIFLTRTRR